MNAPMPAVLVQDAEAWALRIASRWRASIDSIIETGQLLLDAKAALPRGEFTSMLEMSLPFTVNTGQRLMAIARDERISNLARAQLLPPNWTTIYEITKLSNEVLDDAVQRKIIRPEVERSEIIALFQSEHSSDGSGSPVVDNPDDPTASRLQQGLATSSNPGTAAATPRGEGSDAANVAKPEQHPASAPHVAPGPSETLMPSGGLAIAHRRVEPTEGLDFFPTPPWATRALFEHVLVHLDRKKHCYLQRAWEPACGEGHMAYVLREYFRDVHATDIADYGYNDDTLDFLEVKAASADWIITNPPFNDSADLVLKALDLAGTGVAMFVRLTWLESVGRYERIFRDKPPTLLAIFSERVPLHKGRWEENGVTMTAYAWLVWIKGAEPRAPFWIPPGCRARLTKPEDVKRFGKSVAGDDIVEGRA